MSFDAALHTEQTFKLLAAQFSREGYVVIPGLLLPEELDALRADADEMTQGDWKSREPSGDYVHQILPDLGENVLYCIRRIFPKARRNSLLILLANPYILTLIRTLLGNDFACVAEEMILKTPRKGPEIPVHVDCEPTDPRLSSLIVTAGFYLDDATEENGCLHLAKGSHRHRLPAREIEAKGFDFPGLIPIRARAGDVVLHDARTVHGSRRSQGGALRRTIYFEFQSMGALLRQNGPRPEQPVCDTFVRHRLRLLMAAIDARRAAAYADWETPFDYSIPAALKAQYAITWPRRGETDFLTA